MMSRSQSKLMSDFEEKVISFIRTAKSLKNLDREIIETSPSPGSWSAMQCIEHLNRYSDFYLKEFRRGLEKSGSAKEFSPGWLGKKSAESMLTKDGEVKNKMKTFKSKNPALDRKVNPEALDKFIKDQEELLSLLEKAKNVNLNKRVSTTLPLLKFKLGDAMAFYINHEQRHMAQIENTLSTVQKE